MIHSRCIKILASRHASATVTITAGNPNPRVHDRLPANTPASDRTEVVIGVEISSVVVREFMSSFGRTQNIFRACGQSLQNGHRLD